MLILINKNEIIKNNIIEKNVYILWFVFDLKEFSNVLMVGYCFVEFFIDYLRNVIIIILKIGKLYFFLIVLIWDCIFESFLVFFFFIY